MPHIPILKSLFLALFIGLSAPSFARRVTRNFNDDWVFRAPYEVDKGKTTRVQLPHTWNAQDALSGDARYLRGTGNYSKTFTAPKEWEGKRVFVRFQGANSVAHVYLNNKLLAEHRGGYSAFAVELTGGLWPGEKNTLHVSVNNSENADVMPLVGDFNFYGGLYRGVELLVTDVACISPLFYASPGIQRPRGGADRRRPARIPPAARQPAHLPLPRDAPRRPEPDAGAQHEGQGKAGGQLHVGAGGIRGIRCRPILR